MANPFPFVSGQVLTAAEMNGIGEFTTFTPTFTNLTVGNGTVEAYYTRIQDLVGVFVNIVFGSTTSISGDVNLTLPLNRVSGTRLPLGNCMFSDTGTGSFVGFVLSSTTVSQVIIRYGTSVVPLSATAPFTWTTGDVFTVSLFYRKEA